MLVNCQQLTTALDLPIYDIFAPQKVPLLKISDDVIACNLWFAPLQSKTWLRLCGYNRYLSPVTITSDVTDQIYVWLFFGLELELVMIRVGAKFRL